MADSGVGKLEARENTIEEKRVMRRKRNKRKKMERRKMREEIKKKRVRELIHAEAAKLDARRYKASAKKHSVVWKKRTEKEKIRELMSEKAGPDTIGIKTISRVHLTNIDKKEPKTLAQGVFGKCKLKMYQGQVVATKEFKKNVSEEDVKKEASILARLSHPGVPFLLGTDLSKKPYIMVTLFYGIGGNNATLYELLNTEKFDVDHEFKIEKSRAVTIIVKLGETLSYIHNKGILHNDIKSDNIVFFVENTELKPVLIDFGKACPVTEGQYRKLTKDMQLKYWQNHAHIAPEIVDGTAPQSPSTDVYSLGRVVRKIGEFVCCVEIVKLGNICGQENNAKRCTLEFLIDECNILLRKQ